MLSAEVDPYWIVLFNRSYLQMIKHRSHEDKQEMIQKLYDHIPQQMLQGDEAGHIYAKMNMPEDVKVGDDMVDGEICDLDGNRSMLSDIKSDYILLDFWGVGCGPCMQSIPEMERIKEFYGGELTVVSICIQGEASLRSYLERENKMEEHYFEPCKVAMLFELYGNSSVPQYALISPDRKVVDLWSGYIEGRLYTYVSKHLGRYDQLIGIPEDGEVIRLDPSFEPQD